MLQMRKNKQIFNVLFSDKVLRCDVYDETDHIDYNKTFAAFAAKDKHLNILIFVLSFDFLNSVIVDGRKYFLF